jgi:DNA-binding protein H-NS
MLRVKPSADRRESPAIGANRDRHHRNNLPEIEKERGGLASGSARRSSMKQFDFSLFTDEHLKDLALQVKREYLKRCEEARRLVRKRGGLVEGAGPRYRNPENPAETWSGKGKRPSWVEAALAKGQTLASLEISDDRPVPRESPPKRSKD